MSRGECQVGQAKRNFNRFPQDFMFQLNEEEYQSLRSHFATLKIGRGHHRKYLPYVFTEHGTIMLANVLNSPISVQASIQVVRAFGYEVATKVFNQAVKRNIKRLPSDFMFQLRTDEYEALRSQFVTLKLGRGQHRKYLPFVFTEQGVAMLTPLLPWNL